jgi:predicted TPR repeat methyltransferase
MRKVSKKNEYTYGEFAGLYDKMSADGHSLEMVPYVLRIFRRFRVATNRGPLRKGLDLCCGTGSATLALADEDYTMTGVDGSKQMLRHANAKAASMATPSGKRAAFVRGVLPEFRSHAALSKAECFDFAVSFYDSLNYLLTERDLGITFSNVAELLKSGGLFVFDMNSAEALKIIWGGQTYADARDDVAWIWKNQYYAKAKMADAHTTFFARSGKGGLWRRFDETHTERAYTISCVRRLLRKAGFEPLAAYRCFSFAPAKAKDYRYCFVARKR